MAFVSMVKDLVKESKLFRNSELGLQVRMINNPDGSISINAEDTAIGFGWTQTQKKNGREYISVRWERMNGYSAECGFPHEWGKDEYIPEPLFYRLGMKANNKAAEKFQNWLAFKVIPSIRKHGAYMTDETLEKALTSPDFLIQLATKLKEEQEKNKALQEENTRMKPKEIFADAVSSSKTSILVGELAKILRQNGYETGEKRLFAQLRKEGYLV